MRSGALAAGCACAALLAATSVSAANGALDLSFADRGQYLTAEQLRMALGGRVAASGSDEALETVEISPPPGVRESPLQVSIPFGFAGIVWGVRHPGDAWRLIVPLVG